MEAASCKSCHLMLTNILTFSQRRCNESLGKQVRDSRTVCLRCCQGQTAAMMAAPVWPVLSSSNGNSDLGMPILYAGGFQTPILDGSGNGSRLVVLGENWPCNCYVIDPTGKWTMLNITIFCQVASDSSHICSFGPLAKRRLHDSFDQTCFPSAQKRIWITAIFMSIQ